MATTLDEVWALFHLTKQSSIQDICRDAYELLSKYGHSDGDDLLPEEKPIIRYACHALASALGEIEGWRPLVIQAWGHNPYYVGFMNAATEEIRSFYNMDVRLRRKIEMRISELGSQANPVLHR